jgi:SagB-type dehydrogenase family enzyme
MQSDKQVVFRYHEETKHTPYRYAKSLGYLDWDNQPNPFRQYDTAQKIELINSFKNQTPPYHEIFDKKQDIPLSMASISQFLQFSFGISSIKSNGVNKWALRCNASSGNLHPTEAYVILPPIENISKKSSVAHYNSLHHSLEILCHMDFSWDKFPKDSFFLLISSIDYREIWKYGERAFRYVNLDAGHALRSAQISAKTLGWDYEIISCIEEKKLSQHFGFDKNPIKAEEEHADILLLVSKNDIKKPLHVEFDFTCDKLPNKLASNHQNWPIIKEVRKATVLQNKAFAHPFEFEKIKREKTKEAKEVILKRRSAQHMDKSNTKIELEDFLALLKSTKEHFYKDESFLNLALFVHDVKGLQSGLYMYIRVNRYLKELKEVCKDEFLWEMVADDLYLLKSGDFRSIAKQISCSQDIASDGSFSLGMIAPFSQEIISQGTHRYKELHWECGAIGQQLYLEATSLDLSATGIGCFLDDLFHKLLGFQSNQFQSLYHFTIGKALRDNRILDINIFDD